MSDLLLQTINEELIALKDINARLRSELSTIRERTIDECAEIADWVASAYSDKEDANERIAAQWVANKIRALSKERA